MDFLFLYPKFPSPFLLVLSDAVVRLSIQRALVIQLISQLQAAYILPGVWRSGVKRFSGGGGNKG